MHLKVKKLRQKFINNIKIMTNDNRNCKEKIKSKERKYNHRRNKYMIH